MDKVDKNINTFAWAQWTMIDGHLKSETVINFSDIPVGELQKIRDLVLRELDFRMGMPSQPTQGIRYPDIGKAECPR